MGATDTSGILPVSLDSIVLGQLPATSGGSDYTFLNGHIAQFTYIPKASLINTLKDMSR